MQKILYLFSLSKRTSKKFNPKHPESAAKCLNGFLQCTALESSTMWCHSDTEQRFYPQRAKKGKEERRYSVVVFWMESFGSTKTLFSYRDNGSRNTPLRFLRCSSPLPTPRLCICLWAETRGTSCPTRHASQKFTSCSSARLLHTKTIPRTYINSPSFALMLTGTHKQTG